MTEHEAIARVLARAARVEADQRRQILTGLLLTTKGELDDDYIDAQLAYVADRWAEWRQTLVKQVRAEVQALRRA